MVVLTPAVVLTSSLLSFFRCSGLRKWLAGSAEFFCKMVPWLAPVQKPAAPWNAGGATSKGSSTASTPACALKSSSALFEVGMTCSVFVHSCAWIHDRSVFTSWCAMPSPLASLWSVAQFLITAWSVDFPESKPAVEDLKFCLERTNQRQQLLSSLKSALEMRLLHPGGFYISAYVTTL